LSNGADEVGEARLSKERAAQVRVAKARALGRYPELIPRFSTGHQRPVDNFPHSSDDEMHASNR
jgi:hypothetical protein